MREGTAGKPQTRFHCVQRPSGKGAAGYPRVRSQAAQASLVSHLIASAAVWKPAISSC